MEREGELEVDIEFMCNSSLQLIDLGVKLRMLGDIHIEYPMILVFDVTKFVFIGNGYLLEKDGNRVIINYNEYKSASFYKSIIKYLERS